MKFMGRDVCKVTGKVTEYFYNECDDKLIMKETYPNEVVERNARDRNESASWRPMKDGGVAARIPVGLAHQWMRDGINIFDQNDWGKIKSMLNSRDFSKLRTMNGRI